MIFCSLGHFVAIAIEVLAAPTYFGAIDFSLLEVSINDSKWNVNIHSTSHSLLLMYHGIHLISKATIQRRK